MDAKNYESEFKFLGNSIRKLDINNDFINIDPTKCDNTLDICHKIVELKNSDNEFFGMIQLIINASLINENEKYEINLISEGAFSLPNESFSEKTFKDMMNTSGIACLYSIARSFIISTTSQTVVEGNIILPLINVLQYSKDLNEE